MAVLLLDLEKACDRVNWAFVMTTLRQMGFGDCFCRWVKILYSYSTAAVMVNGRCSDEFTLSRSLRQGCPIAPLLFVLQREVLINSIRMNTSIKGLKIAPDKECRVKALADDLFAVCENRRDSLEALKRCLAIYAEYSEAAVNWEKSVFFLPAAQQLQVNWGTNRVEAGKAERFLGIMVALDDCSSSQGLILQERVKSRITEWGEARHLSLIGRALAINVSAFALLWFVAKVRNIPAEALKEIKRVARVFLWKPYAKPGEGCIAKVAWETLCLSREEGGLGLIDPQTQNRILLCQWILKAIETDQEADWVLLAEGILKREWGLDRSEDVWIAITTEAFMGKRIKSRLWKEILQAWRVLRPNLRVPPISKQQILAQHLFDNPRIRPLEGISLSAKKGQGRFGYKWIQRGVATIHDIWDEETNQWKTANELKGKLGQLPEQEERLWNIKEAVPQEWKQLLGPSGVSPPGTWYCAEDPEN
ncbi:hypothetical protein CBR_g50473 [Chara braunii]|uniref:Reverse transcriptase domain-containing protein n=1 Tax=Chara braunii TaxID=69332 RepID=A0A388M707_CHABU|nr:hypothetical protein CBR_g50473 [Chara braunii]|eukprot:GBG90295.1 hypothetical protein CBR_g50473 [Chara braunii]